MEETMNEDKMELTTSDADNDDLDDPRVVLPWEE